MAATIRWSVLVLSDASGPALDDPALPSRDLCLCQDEVWFPVPPPLPPSSPLCILG